MLERIASPVTVSGTGAGFEANLVVSLRAAHERGALAEQPVTAGRAQPRKFSSLLAFERPQAATGAIVVRDGGGLDGVSTAFFAIPVRFAAG